jgi:hypothetical protein
VADHASHRITETSYEIEPLHNWRLHGTLQMPTQAEFEHAHSSGLTTMGQPV